MLSISLKISRFTFRECDTLGVDLCVIAVSRTRFRFYCNKSRWIQKKIVSLWMHAKKKNEKKTKSRMSCFVEMCVSVHEPEFIYRLYITQNVCLDDFLHQFHKMKNNASFVNLCPGKTIRFDILCLRYTFMQPYDVRFSPLFASFVRASITKEIKFN